MMNAVSLVMLVFSLLGAADRILGNRFGLGREFEKGFELLGPLCLSMIGMIVVSPLIATVLQPALDWLHMALGFDPSIVTSMLFANDLGGAALATQVCADPQLGRFNGLVVTSMMGATISFTIAIALTSVKPAYHEKMLTGMLCGVLTIPVGCVVAGLMMAIPLGQLLYNLLPLFLFSVLIALGLALAPRLCTKLFSLLGVGIKILITVGLALGLIQFVTGKTLIPGLTSFEEAANICMGAAVVLTGALPMLNILSRLLKKQIAALSRKLGVNDVAAMGFIACLASSITTFEAMNNMDSKGVMLNSAFAISAAFVFADHLAFTLAYDAPVLPAVIVGKLISGLCAVAVAIVLDSRSAKNPKAVQV